ncbi:hypothetical protein BV25DRAFT_1833094 [Artomyces pyxidatus]|uniref:Uncharacterized protein n=1 Tax=Artomyces pyxidatus TaxID=48021 RepID=A0ACB8SI25_9AGAM|nr:hypothetical protein BV25DRAFT_1833094 [Artomyces pyxidatus]
MYYNKDKSAVIASTASLPTHQDATDFDHDPRHAHMSVRLEDLVEMKKLLQPEERADFGSSSLSEVFNVGYAAESDALGWGAGHNRKIRAFMMIAMRIEWFFEDIRAEMASDPEIEGMVWGAIIFFIQETSNLAARIEIVETMLEECTSSLCEYKMQGDLKYHQILMMCRSMRWLCEGENAWLRGHLLEYSDTTRKRRTQELETLNPTLSTWLDNMARLATLADEVQALGRSAPAAHRQAILGRAAALRDAHKQQQARCIEFLQLTQKYADRYLDDVSDDVHSQEALLHSLERRLNEAKALHSEVGGLRSEFEKGTCARVKSVRKSVLKVPLSNDVRLFEEMDRVLGTIKMCYKELDELWVGEVRRVARAMKTGRVDQEGTKEWDLFQTDLPEAVRATEQGIVTRQGTDPPLPPARPTLPNPRFAPSPIPSINSSTQSLFKPQRHTGSAVSRMLPALSDAGTKLCGLRTSLSTNVHEVPLLQAEKIVMNNRAGYGSFLQHCMDYRRTMAMVIDYAKRLVRSALPLSMRMHDLQVRGRAILKQDSAWPSMKVDDLLPSSYGGDTRVFRDVAVLLQKSERTWDKLCTQRNTVFACVLALDHPETYFGMCSRTHISRVLRVWTKERDVLRGAVARLCA